MHFEAVFIKTEFDVDDDIDVHPVQTMPLPAIKQECPDLTSLLEVPQVKMEPPDDPIEFESAISNIPSGTLPKQQTKSHIPSGTLPKQQTKARSTKTYECLYCQCPFKSWALLLKHLRPDIVLGPLKCMFCDRTLQSYRCCLSHMDHVHLAARPMECEICSEPFHAIDLHEKHVRKIHSIYDCNLCRARFASAPKLKAHRLCHRPVEARSCQQCDRVFSTLPNLKEHVRIVHDVDRMTCSQCNREFANNSKLKLHIRTRHNKDYAYECTVCRNRFPTKRSLATHFSTVCGKNKPNKERGNSGQYECIYCKRRFEKLTELLSHVGPDKCRGTLNCVYCNRSFPSYKCCVRHMDHVHLASDPVKCEVCYEPFHATLLYDQHLRQAHSIYVCNLCPDRFNAVHKWKLHRNLHRSEEYLKCPFCDKISPKLKEHIRIVHSFEQFQCDVCGKFFLNRKKMGQHKYRIHSGVRTWRQKRRESRQAGGMSAEPATAHNETLPPAAL